MLEYLITSYIYSVYPDLKPGQMTDLRSIAVNNTSLAHVAVRRSLHKHLVKDSNGLTTAINKFEQYVALPDREKELVEEPACPKVTLFCRILFVIKISLSYLYVTRAILYVPLNLGSFTYTQHPLFVLNRSKLFPIHHYLKCETERGYFCKYFKRSMQGGV